jgi:two-component system chemotaxis response regulator CheY
MSIRVLIADDAGFVRELLINACYELGYKVVGEARDGQETIDLAMALKPDVILMDLVMPKLNGLEATEKILERYPDISIIACSSLDDELTLKQATDKGCLAFLRKPFNKSSIKTVFQQLEFSKRGQKYA